MAQCPKGKGKSLNNLGEDEAEGLNLGGKEGEEGEEEEEEDKNAKTEKEWNAKAQAAADWESWQNENYGMYWVGKRSTANPYSDQYLGEYDAWGKGAYALYRDEKKEVDQGEIVQNGFQVAKRKKSHDKRIVRFEKRVEIIKPGENPKKDTRNLMAVRPKEDVEMESESGCSDGIRSI